MKRNQRSTLQFHIKDHEFMITLEAIQTTKEMEGIYTLELEKGCKHLQSLKEPIEFDRNHRHIFQQRKAISVKAYKQRNMNFSWSLYKLIDDMYQFVDAFTINLQENYLRYLDDIRNSSFEYSRICQQKDEGQPLGNSWRLMKLHLKYHQFRQIVKNSTGNLILDFTVDIRNEFDRISEVEALKSHKRIEQLDERSTSSRNSLKEKKKVRVMEQEIPSEKQTELKVESIIKYNQHEHEPSKEIDKQNTTQQSNNAKITSPPFLPIQETLMKAKTILSDIIQASNEGESHLNHGDKSDRKPSEYQLELPVKPFAKTKTYHFGNTEQTEPIPIKRNNSFEDFHRSHEQEEDYNGELIRVSEVSEASKDQLTKDSTIIHEQQSIKPIIEPTSQFNSRKYILLILVLYVILAGFLCSKMKDKLETVPRLSKKPKIRKYNLNINNLFQNFE